MRRSLRRLGLLLRWLVIQKPAQVAAEISSLWKFQFLLRILPRESTRAFVATLILGGLCGLIAVAFHGSLEWASHVVSSLRDRMPIWVQLVSLLMIPALAAWIAGVLLVRSRLPAAGSGIPQVKAILMGNLPASGLRVGIVKMVLCVIQVGGGASLGREGPTVQICASVVPRILRVFALPHSMLRRFLPVASAAGIAAAFNTPIAAVTFVVEELMGSSSSTAMTGLVVAAAIAAIEEKLLLGGRPIFHTPAWTFESLSSLPSFLVLGVLGGLLGVVFHRWLLSLRGWFRAMEQFSIPGRMALGGLATGIATLVALHFLGCRGIEGPGYALLDGTLHEKFSMAQGWGALPLKIFATLASYSSGGVGGIFTPVLSIGSLLGAGVGWMHRELPWADATPLGAFALVGMGTFFAAVIRAPITSVLILFELTGDYGLILPLMLANMVAFLISRRMNPKPIYEALLAQDGIEPEPHEEEAWPTVGDLCLRAFAIHPPSLSVADVPQREARGLPIVLADGDGNCFGLVEEIPEGISTSTKLADLVRTQARLRPTDHAFSALSLMSQEGQLWLPVVDQSGVVLGLFGVREALSRLAAKKVPRN